MRVAAKLFFVFALSAIQSLSMQSGRVSPLLLKIEQALECSQKESNPRWQLERTESIKPNENVLIEMFVYGGRRVKVSILEHKSEAEAIAAMKQGAADKSSKPLLKLADEAYSWGYSDAIAFRKGNLTVYVSAVSNIDALLPMLDRSESGALRRSEEVAINKSMARTIANILSTLDRACESLERV